MIVGIPKETKRDEYRVAGSVQITITNNGPSKHNFSLDDGSVSQDLQPGTTQTVTVNLTATVGFHCKYHPTTMKGTIQVA